MNSKVKVVSKRDNYNTNLDKTALVARVFFLSVVIALFVMCRHADARVSSANLVVGQSFSFTENSSRNSYSGSVFIAGNSHNESSQNHEGMQGVAVSDGLNVVVTDELGRFTLPLRPETRFIFITVPAGYKAFGRHYLKTASHTDGYNFMLLPHPVSAQGEVRFIQLADTETFTDDGWIQPIRDYAANEEISFIIHTGDICYEKGLNFHGKYVTDETMGVPVFYCVGNHDLVKGEYGEKLFEDNFGPVYYSFDAGNTHFMVIPMAGGDYPPSYTREDVYYWMKNDLARVDATKNLVVFNHSLLTYDDQFIFRKDSGEWINLNDHNLKAWIYGHWHINHLRKHGSSGVISVCSAPPNKGGIDHSPSHFPVYAIDRSGELTVTRRYNFLDNHFSVVSPNGHNCLINKDNELFISVNTYSTVSPVVSVEFSAGADENWHKLQQKSDWNWSGSWPPGPLVPGEVQPARFRVALKNGDIFSSVRYFSPGQSLRMTMAAKEIPDKKFQTSEKRELAQGLQSEWVTNVGWPVSMGAPVEVNGKVYIATAEYYQRGENSIFALDAQTGEVLWKYMTGSPVRNGLCFDQGYLLATDEDGVAHALLADSGHVVWKKDLGKKGLPAYVSGSVANEGIYYTGSGNYLQAIRIHDGTSVWVNGSWSGGEGSTSTHTLADDILLAGSNWRALYAHDKTSGKKLWEATQEGLRFRSATPAFVQDTLFVTGNKSLIKMNASTGEIYTAFSVEYDLQTAMQPIVTNDMVIVGTATDGLVAFSRASLKEVWKINTGPALVYTAPYSGPFSASVEGTPVHTGDLLLFGASDGYLYRTDIKTGTIVDKIELGAPVLGSLCLAGDRIYIADFSGNIAKFKMAGRE
jgi:outer membrane protein assembly factor BamB/predicted phosphodiesterase